MARAVPLNLSRGLTQNFVLQSIGFKRASGGIMDRLAEIIATFFYVGKIPKAPGTFGSLAALPLAWWVWKLPLPYATSIIAALFFLGVWASHRIIRRTGKEDDQSIVLDEVVGILVTTGVATHLWWQYVLAFCFFRLFDILKPGPISWVDKNVKGGFGAMLDDLTASVFSALLLYIALYFSAYMVAPVTA